MRIISTEKPDSAPFIPCHNFATAVYYKNSADDADIWVTQFDGRAAYYVVIPN